MKKIVFVSLVTALVTTLVSAKEGLHIVKIGETLTEILSENKMRPIYGKQGRLAQVLELNPNLKENGNLIYPGQKILLTSSQEVVLKADKNEEVKPSEGIAEEFKEVTPAVKPNVANMKVDVSLGVRFFRIDGRDNLLMGYATILSEASPNLTLGMTLDWDEQNQLRTEIEYQKYKLQDLNDGRRFTDNSDDQIDLSIMYYHKINPRLTLGLGAKFSEELFFRAISLNEITVNQVFIVKPTFTAKYDIFQKDNAGIGVYADLMYLSSGKTSHYNIKSGAGAEFGGYYYFNSLKKPTQGIIAQAGYLYEKQDTSVTNQMLTDLHFKFGYQWGLDW